MHKISSILPRPIFVADGESDQLTILIEMTNAANSVRFRFENTHPEAAELYDSNTSGDVIFSNEMNLNNGKNSYQHKIGFKLQQSNSSVGANILLKVTLVNSEDEVISSTFHLFTLIIAS